MPLFRLVVPLLFCLVLGLPAGIGTALAKSKGASSVARETSMWQRWIVV